MKSWGGGGGEREGWREGEQRGKRGERMEREMCGGREERGVE